MSSFYTSSKALVIGISRYADPQHDLNYARSDAEALAAILSSEFGFAEVQTLYDGDATRRNILRFFEEDLQRVGEDDGVLIFFAGHGITVTSAIGDERGFLVPHDGDPRKPYTNISLTAVRDDYLPMIPAKHVFLIIDACYSGLVLRDIAAVAESRTITEQVIGQLTRRDRKMRQVLAAGTKDQQVLDGGLFGHSIFTGRLMEALQQANPYITADQVGAQVKERVARDAYERAARQLPQFGCLFGGEGSFVFVKGGANNAQGNHYDLGPCVHFASVDTGTLGPSPASPPRVADLAHIEEAFLHGRIEAATKRLAQLQVVSDEGVLLQAVVLLASRPILSLRGPEADRLYRQLHEVNDAAWTPLARLCMRMLAECFYHRLGRRLPVASMQDVATADSTALSPRATVWAKAIPSLRRYMVDVNLHGNLSNLN